AKDPAGLLAWCLGPEAAAGRFDADLLPDTVLKSLAQDPAPLFKAAQMAERSAAPTDLQRRLGAAFGAGQRARWPDALTAPLRDPYLQPAPGHPAPFVKLFLEIWEPRPDLQRLYPLTTTLSRVRYLRWLIAGGLTEYGVELAALPPAVRNHPMFRLAELSVRRHRRPVSAAPPVRAAKLLVLETVDGATIPADTLAYDAATGRFQGPGGPSAAPGRVDQVVFRTAPALVPADAIALYAKGVRWSRATAAWTPEQVKALAKDDLVRGFVDEIETPADKALATNP
ncbi:MAG: hypothetical protein ACREEG_05445, partial [Phenylobacterium sp.]